MDNKEKADALYHGDVYEGKVITRFQVQKHIMKIIWQQWALISLQKMK